MLIKEAPFLLGPGLRALGAGDLGGCGWERERGLSLWVTLCWWHVEGTEVVTAGVLWRRSVGQGDVLRSAAESPGLQKRMRIVPP